jgi:hypothetical protein
MSRPRLKVEQTPFDYLMEGISVLAVAGTLLFFFILWGHLPEKIPIHYNVLGEADATGNKWFSLILPLVGLGSYFGMSVLNKYPHIFNYPVEVNEQNALPLYRIGRRSVLGLKMLVCLLIFYMSFSIASNFIHLHQGLWLSIFLFFILLISVLPIYSIIAMNRMK